MAWSAPWITVEVGYGSTWQTEPGSITWTDETARVLIDGRVRCRRGASSARGKVDVGTAEFSLKNGDRRFDPTHATGDLFGDLLPGTPVRLLAWPVDQLVTVDGEIVLVDGLPVTTGTAIELWSGTVPSWPQRYDKSNRHAWCPISAYDRFDKLSRAKIPRSVLEAEVLADSPVAYWPLDETSGAVMREVTGSHKGGRYKYGTTALSTEYETPASNSVRLIDFDGGHYAEDPLCGPLVTARPCTVELLTEFTDTSDPEMLFATGNGDPDGGIRVSWLGQFKSLFANANVDGLGTGTDAVYANDLAYGDGVLHHVAFRCPSAGDSVLYVDGVDETDLVTYSDSQPSPPGAIVAANKANESDIFFTGMIGHVVVFDTDIGSTRVEAHASAALAPLDGQTTDERITWILDEIAWPAGFRDLSTGRSMLGAATFKPGDGALEYLRLIEATEDGLLFIGPDGSLVFHDRYWRYLETVATVSQFTFTDQDGDQGYAEFQLDLDDELLVNVARYTRRDGTEQVVSDSSSVAAYGEAEEVLTDLLSTTDAQVRSLAEWAVSTKSLPLPRVPAIRVPLHRYSAADQATVLGLDLGHRVTVNRTPQGVGAQIDLDFQVEGVSHDIGFNEWWVTLFVSPVPEDTAELFILGSSELGGTHILAH